MIKYTVEYADAIDYNFGYINCIEFEEWKDATAKAWELKRRDDIEFVRIVETHIYHFKGYREP